MDDQPEGLGQALAELIECLSPLRELMLGEQRRLVAEGFDPKAASEYAVEAFKYLRDQGLGKTPDA